LKRRERRVLGPSCGASNRPSRAGKVACNILKGFWSKKEGWRAARRWTMVLKALSEPVNGT